MKRPTRPRGFAALLLLGTLLLVPAAAAQTALLDTPLFHLNDDGGLVSLGTVGTGTIPATGPGARLMWHPKKAAFRAGLVGGTQWDEAYVGNYSVAMGRSTMASGDWSVAMGEGTEASGDWSVAMGWNTTASGQSATAMGRLTTASGQSATAMGSLTTASGLRSTTMGGSTTASGNYATAMGSLTTASGNYATAMGRSTTATGDNATAMSYLTTASGDYAVAMGLNTEASGSWSVAMGEDTEANGDWSVAMGEGTEASGSWAVAMGEGTAATGDRATAMGLDTQASGNYATTFGRETLANGILATAMGRNTVAQAFASLVIGRYNVISGNPTGWSAANPVFVVGNGSGPATADRSNALTLLGSGTLQIAGTLLQNSDRRLKTDIEPLSEAVSGLGRLQPVRFRFREGMNRPEGEHLGLIAQEVEAVFPALVSEGADGYLSVSYTNLTAVLVQALNEQQKEIEALHDRLARLEAALLQAGAGPEPGADR